MYLSVVVVGEREKGDFEELEHENGNEISEDKEHVNNEI